MDGASLQEVPGRRKAALSGVGPGPAEAVRVRFYAELNDYLPRDRRFRACELPLAAGADVAALLRREGIPAGEVDLVLVNGDSVGLDHRPRPGDRIAVSPVFDAFDVSELQNIRDRPLRRPAFVLDVHLGTLARYLRMLGFDTAYSNRATDEELVARSLGEERVLLSRDRALVSTPGLRRAFHIRAQEPLLQLTGIIRRLDLAGSFEPFTRCLRCNTLLREVEKQEVAPELPPRVRESFDRFHRCGTCGRLYWRGSHFERMERLVLHFRAKHAIFDPTDADSGEPDRQ